MLYLLIALMLGWQVSARTAGTGPGRGDFAWGDGGTFPRIADDYARTFARLKSLPCEIFLASRASFFSMTAKAARVRGDGPNPFVDTDLYRVFLERTERTYLDQIARERKGQSR